MAKSKKTDDPVQPVDEAPETDTAPGPESKAPPPEEFTTASARDQIAGLDAAARAADREERKTHATLAERRKAAAEARAKLDARLEEERRIRARKDTTEQVVPVVVQTRKERPVRLPEGVIPCRVPVKVTRRGLRRLEGMRRQGKIQLIVGEIDKPGKVLDPREGRATKS